MPSGGTALTVVGPYTTPAGTGYDEQQSDASPGNIVPNARGTILVVRNTNASSRTLTFYADIYGVERTVMTATAPGSGTETGISVHGPFPAAVFNDHTTTESGSNGKLLFSHNGADADLMICPLLLNLGLAT